ncbi:serine hydrolase [Moheibacter sediminis]|uniref:CubicO group peptidase, beta-lactamase class C family n=1 Tax=Moheibacter sediminis TaxID=1434700 RepID=A0A1W2BUS6_9FLAO|nr:serine hydrolase [Moheibacter sediminis]SMC76707.1 CubicO group peptidase, beta-lactamase class C family [Moheibacter sediminis]
MNIKKYLLIFTILLCTISFSQEIPEKKVDDLVNQTLKAFNVPGIAVGIIHDGKIILAKGYGIADITTGAKVNSSTNFGIASNSKAFTTAAIAILVDEGKMKWDDKVIQFIPEFKMYNDYVTQEFTIRDLVTHRSGLGLGAGDLMVWPDGHNFTPTDIIKNIQYLKPVSDFRSKYDYDNLLYIIAGVVIERISGKTWTKFIQERILNPLQMDRTAPNWDLLKDKSNAIAPHVPIDGELKVIDRYTNPIFDAAAGIYSNIDDLSKWVLLNLNKGKHNDHQIISEAQIREMTKPQTLMPIATKPPYNSLFRAYGLGFQLQDVAGKLEVSHTGGLEGIVTQIVMYPQLNLGVIVLTNQQEGAAFMAVSNTIKDHYLGLPEKDWVKEYDELISKRGEEADKITDEVWQTVEKNKKSKSPDAKNIIGTYKDNWFGEITISENKGKLRFVSKRSPQLSGDMFYYKDNTYAVKWDNAYLHADAFVFVQMKDGKVSGLKMETISPLTDFSYDFQDLDFSKN